MKNLFILLLLALSPLAHGQNINDQKDFDFELEEEKVQYQDTKDALKAGKEEAVRQRRAEAEDKRKLDKAKSENQHLMNTVLPQIKELKQQVLKSEANQKATLAELQKVDAANANLKQQLVDKKDQLKVSKELELETRNKLIEARREQLALIKENAAAQKELRNSQLKNQKMQKMLDNPRGLQMKPAIRKKPVSPAP